MNQDIGEEQIAKELYKRYQTVGVSLQGLKVLARRGLARGYPKNLVTLGLDTVIKKTMSGRCIGGMMHEMRDRTYQMRNLKQSCDMALQMIFCGADYQQVQPVSHKHITGR